MPSCTAAICPKHKQEMDDYCKLCKFYWLSGENRCRQVPSGAMQVITKEVVMLPCKYCGTVFPETDVKCPKCGAAR